TYAVFTGLSFFAQAWWHLLIFRFLAALGVGGEWAVGASLLVETWPRKWRPWMAAVLQMGVNVGILFAVLANHVLSKAPPRSMFLVIGSSIVGNFFSAWLARKTGYRAAIAVLFLLYFASIFGTYCVPRDHTALLWWFPAIGFCQGVFALFTMYLPPLFPTLLRT